MELREFTVDGKQHAALLPIVENLEGVNADTPILDLGCGTGAWLSRLAGAGYSNLWGTDLNAESFGAHQIARFISADIMHLNQPLNVDGPQFGFISAIELIEHVANPERIIEVACRNLAPRGWFLLTTPNIYSIRARMRFLFTSKVVFFDTNAAPDHIHPLLLDAFKRHILPRYPLGLERVWPYPAHGSSGSRWFADLAARALSLVLPNYLPGDTICLLLRKSAATRVDT